MPEFVRHTLVVRKHSEGEKGKKLAENGSRDCETTSKMYQHEEVRVNIGNGVASQGRIRALF